MVSKKDKRMSLCDTAEAQSDMHEAFGVRRYGSVKAAHNAAYEFMKPYSEGQRRELKFRRIRQLWEGKAAVVAGWEKDALRRAKIEEAKREQQELRERLSELDQALAILDQRQAGFVGSQESA